MLKRRTAASLSPIPHSAFRIPPRSGLTLIEMLMATAITLLMMAAIVNLFANLSGSISNRRAIIELSGQLRQVRQRLARDLAGCTVPPGPQGLMPWRQRAGEAIGYLEIIEGNRSDRDPTGLNVGLDAEIDTATSIIPGSQIIDPDSGEVTDASGLGDADDILALTVRSLGTPFTGRLERYIDEDNDGVFEWEDEQVESSLAEVVWFAIENPANGLLGEPGMRSIYRRAFLIAPWIAPIPGPPQPPTITPEWLEFCSNWFHQRYDISARYDEGSNQWIPNTLEDLTRREYRCYRIASAFPHHLATGGAGYTGTPTVLFNRGLFNPNSLTPNATAAARIQGPNDAIGAYEITNDGGVYNDVVGVTVGNNPIVSATARPVMYPLGTGGQWGVAALTFGPAPLAGHIRQDQGGPIDYINRQGGDLVANDALGFDVRVFDPGAPLFNSNGVLVDPGDPGWLPEAAGTPVGYGAYVDLGWNNNANYLAPGLPYTSFQFEHRVGWHPSFGPDPTFSIPNPTPTNPFRRGESVYDTWTWHYENDGADQYGDGVIDIGTNGIDDEIPVNTGFYVNGMARVNGVDDVAERESSPPYPVPLRGVKVIIRTYERDARQVREVSVTNSFVP